MTTHYLKIERRWYDRISADQKHAEVRIDDRDYQTGDQVVFNVPDQSWTHAKRTITHVLRTAPGLIEGYVVLSLKDSRLDRLGRVEREVERLTRSNRSLRARARSLAGKS